MKVRDRINSGLIKYGLVGLILAVILSSSAFASDITIYVEGLYTDQDLITHIYADINDLDLLSFGVKLSYSTSELTLTTATRNEETWYFGNGSTNHPYPPPDTNTPGEVIIIGGKLDTNSPMTGVTGRRVLLGVLSFDRLSNSSPMPDPVSFFGLAIELGKGGGYANFVTAGKNVFDPHVDFTAITIAYNIRAMPWIPLLLLDD